jgi:hypothetical protein
MSDIKKKRNPAQLCLTKINFQLAEMPVFGQRYE